MKETLIMNNNLSLVLLGMVVMLAIAFIQTVSAQEIKREGNNFTVENALQQSTDVQTKYTFTIKDNIYPIWITKNGRCYIIRTSKNGNQYKQYLNKDICLQICQEMNIEYKE